MDIGTQKAFLLQSLPHFLLEKIRVAMNRQLRQLISHFYTRQHILRAARFTMINDSIMSLSFSTANEFTKWGREPRAYWNTRGMRFPIGYSFRRGIDASSGK